jgi:hypothetical protein
MVLALGLMSCEGDQGPLGPAGPTGPKGDPGTPGATGPQGAGTQNCIECHGSSQLLTGKLAQWENSGHATGGHNDRNTTTCAVCHTSQGFVERAATQAQATAATIADPLPINCYTCHKIHSTYTKADWNLTVTSPQTFWSGGATVDVGKGNLCVSCHQARPVTPALPNPTTGGTIRITNSRYGPHHGSQGMMFTGKGGYEVGTGYTNSTHTTLIKDACTTCHMATAVGSIRGGHTFKVSTEDEETGVVTYNTAGCVACHANATDLNNLIKTTQTEIDALTAELKGLLVTKGILNATTDLAIVPKDLNGHEAGALYNYKFVEEDQSSGMHNYKYAKILLQNSINAIK